MHLCGCPSASPVCASEEKNAVLCGEKEPNGDDTTYYKDVDVFFPTFCDTSNVIENRVYSVDEDGDCDYDTTHNPVYVSNGNYYENEIETFSGTSVEFPEGMLLTSINPATTTSTRFMLEDDCGAGTSFVRAGSWSYNYSNTYCLDNRPGSNTSTRFRASGTGTLTWSGTGGSSLLSGGTGAITEVYEDWDDFTCGDSGGNMFSTFTINQDILAYLDLSSGSLTYSDQVSLDFSDPDTDEAALDRADIEEGNNCGSLYESRSTTKTFTHRTSSYAILADNLIPGAGYKAIVVLERRAAIKDGSGGYVDADGNPSVWEETDDDGNAMIDEYIFDATSREMVVPGTGTWVDAGGENADGEISSDEITPLVEIPIVSGFQYRIKGGYPKVQLALTAE